jgi:hypothetical protein
MEIPAKDRHAAEKFFAEMFGWGEFAHMDEYMYSTFAAGNMGGGFADISDTRKPGTVVFYVLSPDIDADIQAAEANGGKVMIAKMPIPGDSFIAWIADPAGNSIGLIQAGPSDQQPKSCGQNIVHIEIPAQSRDTSAKFFQKLFGWDFNHMDEMQYSMAETGTDIGVGYPDFSDMYKAGDIIIYVASHDLAADAKKITNLGGQVMGEPMEVPGMGAFLIFADPNGNRLALWKSAQA